MWNVYEMFLCNIAAQIQKQCMWILQVIRKINKKSGIDVKPQFSSSKCYSKTKVQLTDWAKSTQLLFLCFKSCAAGTTDCH